MGRSTFFLASICCVLGLAPATSIAKVVSPKRCHIASKETVVLRNPDGIVSRLERPTRNKRGEVNGLYHAVWRACREGVGRQSILGQTTHGYEAGAYLEGFQLVGGYVTFLDTAGSRYATTAQTVEQYNLRTGRRTFSAGGYGETGQPGPGLIVPFTPTMQGAERFLAANPLGDVVWQVRSQCPGAHPPCKTNEVVVHTRKGTQTVATYPDEGSSFVQIENIQITETVVSWARFGEPHTAPIS